MSSLRFASSRKPPRIMQATRILGGAEGKPYFSHRQ
jgi:hypothetical protein